MMFEFGEYDFIKWKFENQNFLEFSTKFFGECSERLKWFQALLIVLWNILTLHTCLLMKHNPMSINRGLCSPENSEHKKSCGHSPELLSVEPNILIVS